MKTIFRFIKTTLVGGLLFVLPVWLSVLLLVKSLGALTLIFKPIMKGLPEEVNHPFLASVLVLVLGCFVVGLLIQTSLGCICNNAFRTHVLDHIPGYAVLRGLTEQLTHHGYANAFAPCLAEIEEALVPAFIVERHTDGRFTVFVPSAPTPVAGSIYILAPERVHPIDVSVLKVMSCVSKWGSGSSELLSALPGPCSADKNSAKPQGDGSGG